MFIFEQGRYDALDLIHSGTIMIRRLLLLTAFCLQTGCANLSQVMDSGAQMSQAAGYNPAQLSTGVKEALTLSVDRASDLLSQNGGYSNSVYRVQLPDELQQLSATLARFGLNDQVEKVEGLMNRGAEIAAGEAKQVFLQAIKEMSIDDAIGIVRGGDSAATAYFRDQTEAMLQQRYQSIVQNQLEQLGFYSQYQQLLSAYKLLPIANKPSLDLEQTAINQGINGLFKQIAAEEGKIRQNPLEQGSLLLAGIFGRK